MSLSSSTGVQYVLEGAGELTADSRDVTDEHYKDEILAGKACHDQQQQPCACNAISTQKIDTPNSENSHTALILERGCWNI